MKKVNSPTGKERMKRRPLADHPRPARLEYDIKKAYTQDQLYGVGAIVLIWNQIEDYIEFLMLVAFSSSFTSLEIWLEIMNKIGGVRERVELLRKHADKNKILDANAKKCIKSTFDAVLEYKTYRNGIVHSRIFDHEKGIALYIDSARNPWHILLTKEALVALYNRLLLLKDELREIDLLYRMAEGEKRIIVINKKTGRPEVNQLKALQEIEIPNQTKRVLKHQNRRLKLSPLPQFPDVDLIMPKIEALKIQAHTK